MTSRAIDPQEDRAIGATHWSVYDDDPRVDWHFGPFESQADAEAFAEQRNGKHAFPTATRRRGRT